MAILLDDAAGVGDEPTERGKLAPLIDRGNRMACGKLNNSFALAIDEWIPAYKKGTGSPLHECREGDILPFDSRLRSGLG